MATSKIQNRSRTRAESENGCPVCHERMDIFAIGRCDHVVCYKCATRMRVLCDQKYCAICRADLQQLLFVRHRHKFESVPTTSFCINRQFMIFFEDSNILERFDRLLENRCKLCPEKESFAEFTALDKHMKREHVMFYCKLCVEHLKLFSVDRKFYNRQQLAQHNRHGDSDDTSYKGHPLCQFCSEHYFDNDELLRHLRKQHFFCHFCEADGVTSEYFSDYNALRDHFKAEHILCEEGSCAETQFVNVFRSDIDYRAHWAQSHSTGAARQHIRQMRTLDIDVNFAPRDQRAESGYQRRGGPHKHRGGAARNDRESDRQNTFSSDTKQTVSQRREAERKHREEIDQAHALSMSLAAHGHISLIDPALVHNSLITTTSVTTTTTTTTDRSLSDRHFQRRSDDFPTLSAIHINDQQTDSSVSQDTAAAAAAAAGSSDQSLSLAKKLALSSRFSVSNGSQNYNEFPCLPTSSQPQRPISAPQVKQKQRRVGGCHNITDADFPALQSNRPTTATGGSTGTGTTSHGAVSGVNSTSSTAGTTNARTSSATSTIVASKVSKAGNSKKSLSASVAWSVSERKPSAMSRLEEAEEDFPGLPAQRLEMLSHQTTLSSLSDISRNFSNNSLSALGNDTAALGETQRQGRTVQGETEWGQSVPQGQAQRGHSALAAKQNPYPSIVNDDTWGPALYHQNTSTTEPTWKATKHDKKTSGQKWQSGKPDKQVEEGKKHSKNKGKTSVKDSGKNSEVMNAKTSARETGQKTRFNVTAEENGKQTASTGRQPTEDMASTGRQMGEDNSRQTASTGGQTAGDIASTGRQMGEDNGRQTTSTGRQNVEMEQGKDDTWKTVMEKCNTTAGGKKKQSKENGATGAISGTGMCGDGSPARFSVLVDESSDVMLTDKNTNKNNLSTKRNLKRKDTTNTDLTDVMKKSQQNSSTANTGSSAGNTGTSTGSKGTSTGTSTGSTGSSTGSNVESSSETVTDNKENIVTDPEDVTVDAGFTLFTDDFPCLRPTTSAVDTPVVTCSTPAIVTAPPGFHHGPLTAVPPVVAVAKPPPGFTAPCVRLPPGLTTPAVPSSTTLPLTTAVLPVVDSITPVEQSVTGVIPVTYVAPRDAVQRNQRLLDNITSVVRDIAVFRELSADFRCNKLSAAEYHLQCRSIMSSTDCLDIFPELIALLPDIAKQQELLKVHGDFVKSTDWSTSECRSTVGRSTWSTVSSDLLSLVTCVVCGQVVQVTDQQQHQLEHNFDSDFPSLEKFQHTSVPCSVR